MKIKVIIPNSGMDRETLDDRERMLSKAVSSDVEISVDCIPSGPESIESCYDEIIAAPLVLDMSIQAEKDGFDAVVLYCFSDVGIDGIRDKVCIPVIGPGEVSIAAASMISVRFAVVTTISRNIPRTEGRLIKNPTAREKMKAVLALDIPVAELRDNPDVTKEYLRGVCKKAVEDYGVDTLILGCLGMAEYGDALESEFGIKVLDPAFLALGYAEFAARNNLIKA